MAVRGYILVQTKAGTTRSTADVIQQLEFPNVKLVQIDTVAGPFSIIMTVAADDLDKFDEFVRDGIKTMPGVQEATTCVSIRFKD